MPAQWSCLWLVLDRKTFSMQNCLWWRHETGFSSKVVSGTRAGATGSSSYDASRRALQRYTPCCLVPWRFRPPKPQKTHFGTPFSTPMTPSKWNESDFFSEKDVTKILTFCDFQNPFVSHRDRVIAFLLFFWVTTVILAVVKKGEITLLIGVRHYDFCRVDVTATWNGGRFKRRGASR